MNKQFKVGERVICTWGSNKGLEFVIKKPHDDCYICKRPKGDGTLYKYDDDKLEAIEQPIIELVEGTYHEFFQEHHGFSVASERPVTIYGKQDAKRLTDGMFLTMYFYSIDGYEPENGKLFVSRSENIVLTDELPF